MAIKSLCTSWVLTVLALVGHGAQGAAVVNQATIGLLGAVISAAALWVVARLKASGKIGTSEAARLWDAQERFRADLTAQGLQLRSELNVLRVEHEKLRMDHAACQTDMAALHAVLAANGIGPDRRSP